MQLSDIVLTLILEKSSFLRRVNGFCKIARTIFLQRGAYFTSSCWAEDYFIYLLSQDKYEIFVDFVDKGHLLCKDGNLQTKKGEKIRFCYVNRAKAPEKSRIATYLQSKNVYMNYCCAPRSCNLTTTYSSPF